MSRTLESVQRSERVSESNQYTLYSIVNGINEVSLSQFHFTVYVVPGLHYVLPSLVVVTTRRNSSVGSHPHPTPVARRHVGPMRPS